MKRIWKYIKRLIILALLCMTIFLLSSVYYIKGFENKVQSGKKVETAKKKLTAPVPEAPINIVLMGSDARLKGERGRSDTLAVASVLPSKNRAVLISIPRDSRVFIPGHGNMKINNAYAFGGPSLAIETVEKFLGMDIHHFAEVDFKGFPKIIDAFWGSGDRC